MRVVLCLILCPSNFVFKKKYMKKILFFAVVALSFVACKKDKEDVVELNNNERYTFAIEVKGFWTPETHPTDYPESAKFAEIVAITHSENNILFHEGHTAPTWLTTYIKTEKSDSFKTLYAEYKANGKVDAVAVNEGMSATKTASFQVTTTGKHDKFSILAKLSPSPDWFIALNNIDLNPLSVSTGFTYIMPVYDAGIFDGATYTEQGNATTTGISLKKDAPIIYPEGGVSKFAIVTVAKIATEKIK